ncbi:MAG: DnaJ C-terminal domain-containing protein [Roseovarius sp.]
MSDDPYKVLGVSKTATQDEIKKAYRKLARKLHPDIHPGDPGKKAEFQEVSSAYDLLGDAEKRRRFDSGEIDAKGHERPERNFYHQYAHQQGGRRYDPNEGMENHEDFSDLFSDLFGQRARAGQGGFRPESQARGADLRYHLEVDFMDAAKGAKQQVTMPDGNRIEVSIPAGLKNGQTLRLRGKGSPGFGESPPGDALVTITVRPHPVFTREGDDVEIELPITFDEAVLGAKVDVPTISGAVSMTIPRGASSGRRLRLKGKGLPKEKGSTGDQIVRLKIVLPEKVDDDMVQLAQQWRDHVKIDPREALRRIL